MTAISCSLCQSCHDDPCANRFLANVRDSLGNLALRIADQIGDDVGVEQVTHYRSTGPGMGSGIDRPSKNSKAWQSSTNKRLAAEHAAR
jgi:hypothetical protein